MVACETEELDDSWDKIRSHSLFRRNSILLIGKLFKEKGFSNQRKIGFQLREKSTPTGIRSGFYLKESDIRWKKLASTRIKTGAHTKKSLQIKKQSAFHWKDNPKKPNFHPPKMEVFTFQSTSCFEKK